MSEIILVWAGNEQTLSYFLKSQKFTQLLSPPVAKWIPVGKNWSAVTYLPS